MTDKQYRVNCEIEYSQDYLKSRDMTLIFEEMFMADGPDKVCVRERICGFYHGEPDDDLFKQYMTSGTEAVMEDEFIKGLTREDNFDMGQWLKDNGVTDEYVPKEEPKYDYAVVIYGGFDETPLIRYQREYDDKDQALEVYYELEDTFRLEHKIFDNNTEEFIAQEDCSAMALIKCGPYDDEEVTCFKSLIDKTNLSYDKDYRQIVDYLAKNCNLLGD